MGDTEYINIRGLAGMTTNESIIMGGQTGRDLASLFWDVASKRCVTDRHAQEFLRLSQPFQTALTLVATNTDGALQSEGGLIAPDASFVARAIGTAEESFEGKRFTALNISSAHVSSTGLFGWTMSYPVKWHTKHIDDRMKERGGGYTPDSYSPMFRMHNAMALSMLRKFEEKHDRGYFPFALPERNGILLGHTVPLAEDHHKNRIFMMAKDTHRSYGLAPYEWLPKMAMTVRTFIGHAEMTPAQANLRKALLPFYAGEKSAALLTEIDRVLDTKEDQRFMSESYVRATTALENIMDSPAWKKGTWLPRKGNYETHLTL